MKNHTQQKEKESCGRKRQCGCGKHSNVTEHKEAIQKLKMNEEKQAKKPYLIPAKFYLCDYCANYFEELDSHLLHCEVKKFIEEEDKKYYESLKERVKHDETIASQFNNEEQKKRIDDEKIAKELQFEFEKQNAKQTVNDIDIAKKLQEEFDKQTPRLNDAELAKKLQLEYENQQQPKSTDAELAQKLQLEYQNQSNSNLTDEELAKKYEKEFNDDL